MAQKQEDTDGCLKLGGSVLLAIIVYLIFGLFVETAFEVVSTFAIPVIIILGIRFIISEFKK